MAPRKRVGDMELSALLDGRITNAVGWSDGKLAIEERRVLRYYDAEFPARTRRGQSSYVSQDVHDSVEAMHAQLLETFTGSQDLARFAPRGPDDAAYAQQLTDACHYVVHGKNPGYEVFSDVMKAALMTRFGAAKVSWQVHEEITEEEASQPVSEEALAQLAAPDEVEEVEAEDQGDGTYRVTIKKRTKRGCPKIEAVPRKELLVSRRAKCLEEADFVAHRVHKTRGQLKNDHGLSDSQIDDLRDLDDRPLFDEDDDARFRPVDDEGGAITDDQAPERGRVWVYECYLRGDFDGDGVEGLYQVVKAGNTIVSRERIKRLPFVVFVPLRRPFSFWGNNFADRVIPVQASKTGLVRAILDHTAIATNPRLTVVRGTLQNPQELNDDRLGGIVNVNRPDGIQPLMQAPLNPFVFQTLQLLDYDNEDTTGVSRLSQGLNKDALSSQNSGALVEQLTSNGQTRQKVIARNFAMTFLVPLYQLVAELLQEHAGDEGFEYIRGEQAAVLPRPALDVKRDLICELHLGYGEADKEAQKFLAIYALLSQDPTLAPLFGPDKKYRLLVKVLNLKGIQDVGTYLTPPEQAQPPQPDPLKMAEVQLKQQELQLNAAKAQLETMEVQAKIRQMMAKMQLDQQKQDQKVGIEQQRLDLERAKLALETMVEQAEVEAMRTAEAAGGENFKAIASPNG